ncbi:acyclic sesquiterpene synthase-like isoform X1 [Hordeum vulgare subsp. vulgare]|uniref:acyclic sesquiterpene synthase-like isoform X1 n=1 Tax=Hordeum vulgare subsp. vulgare TaxID=112509 RepID=UPI001D1A3ADA|nr:acyclic sesquiterpene synthase-like isoform X1 [Hordeum vulgare subsp. vulgare]
MGTRGLINLPTSLSPPSGRCTSSVSGLPCGVLPVRWSRSPRPTAARGAKNRQLLEVGESAAGMQNQLLGLVNGMEKKKARETRTKQQLQAPSSDNAAGVATAAPLPGSPEIQCFPTTAKTIHRQLSTVDVLEKIGISRHFAAQIKSILEFTYSRWLQRDEEIMLDTETCAMAFRILRMNGYDVSSDGLSHLTEASVDLNDTRSLLELYKVSQLSTSKDELILDIIGFWSGRLLKEQLSSSKAQRTPLLREVRHALHSPFYTTLDRLEHKMNIEEFDFLGHQMLYFRPWQRNQDLLALGVMDFNTSQLVYQQELQHLESWVKERRLNQLPFARQKLAYFYLSAAGTMFPGELSDARILWAKNGALTTVVDDFFDAGGSKEELENLTTLVEMWDRHDEIQYYSKHVEIVFSAIYSSVNQLGAKASAVQGRNVTKHFVDIWQDLLRNMMTEVEWRETRYIPRPEEYMENAVVTFALGPVVLPALYFIGPKITEYTVGDTEYKELFRLMSTCGRLLNDVQTYEREYMDGKINSVSLLVHHSGGSMTIPEAREELQEPIENCRRDLLRLVLKQDSAVPRQCKELFWKMCKTCYFFYYKGDAFSSAEKAGAVDAVIHEPLQLPMDLLLPGLDLSSLCV